MPDRTEFLLIIPNRHGSDHTLAAREHETRPVARPGLERTAANPGLRERA
jgi:hypothetical protein